MDVLAIHTGHGATAALLRDGKILACASEERFTRKKNQMGWPEHAVRFVLEHAGTTAEKCDLVVLPSTDMRSHELQLFNQAPFHEHNKPGGQRTFTSAMRDVAKRRFMKNKVLWESYLAMQERKYAGSRRQLEQRIKTWYAQKLGVQPQKLLFIDHHYAHATSPAFNLPRDRKTLVLTLDGEGDSLCASVNVFDGVTMRRVAATRKDHSLGWLYFQVTRHLGMKGNEHEFKVMGLAPYAKGEHVDKVYARLKELIWLDPHNPLRFDSAFPMPFLDVWLNDNMRGVRFDNLAGGAQKLTEELILAWVRAAIKHTGIPDVAISGGVFMNVKANMRIAQLPEVASLFVMPSAGDESLVFGAAWHGYTLLCRQRGAPCTPVPFSDLYLGKSWSNEEIGEYLLAERIADRYAVRFVKDIDDTVAALLARGEVVARCVGRAEWGARALGNRSILANPADFETVKLINEMIKNRDFWMPFTPSMLDTDERRYVVNPKHVPAQYMCITFDSTPLAQQHLPAAMHPYDKTIRPQVVREAWNPSYYAVLKGFKRRTGTGAILNTSFNLHGEPNVNSPADAIHTLDNSGLRNLALGNYLIQKRDT